MYFEHIVWCISKWIKREKWQKRVQKVIQQRARESFSLPLSKNQLSHTTTARIVNFICVVVAPVGGRHCLGSLPSQSCLCILAYRPDWQGVLGTVILPPSFKPTPLVISHMRSLSVSLILLLFFYASLIHIVYSKGRSACPVIHIRQVEIIAWSLAWTFSGRNLLTVRWQVGASFLDLATWTSSSSEVRWFANRTKHLLGTMAMTMDRVVRRIVLHCALEIGGHHTNRYGRAICASNTSTSYMNRSAGMQGCQHTILLWWA